MAKSTKNSKKEKLNRVLFGLVEYFLKTGKPVGSNTLKEAGFQEFSSATIRNYFVELETEGFLKQSHTSGGRVPTKEAFRFYVDEVTDELEKEGIAEDIIVSTDSENLADSKEIARFLQFAADAVSESTKCAAFISSPRFDQDFVTEIKLVGIDHHRILAVLVTSFGQILTEQLHSPHKFSTISLKKIEEYFQSRLAKVTLQDHGLSHDEYQLACRFYQEIMARYFVRYVNFSHEDVFRTGFSKLLHYPEFQEAESLTAALSIFENEMALRALVRDTIKSQKEKVWLSDELYAFLSGEANCSIIACPYSIAGKKLGSIGIIGPMRQPYKHNMALVMQAARDISQALEKSLYKHKISYRTPAQSMYLIGEESRKLLAGPDDQTLLEHKD